MVKGFMRIVGIILIVVGIVGFITPLTGILDLTPTHNLIHLVTGILAYAVSGNFKGSVTAAKIFGVIYLLVGIVGLFTNDLFGLIMLMPLDTVIHFLIGFVSLYLGFNAASTTSINKAAKLKNK